jgi:hypothetical protein
MGPIERLLEEIWTGHSAESQARKQFQQYREQVAEIHGYASRCESLICAMLSDRKVNLRDFNEAEARGQDYLFQCLHGASEDLMAAHTRLLKYYEASRGEV